MGSTCTLAQLDPLQLPTACDQQVLFLSPLMLARTLGRSPTTKPPQFKIRVR